MTAAEHPAEPDANDEAGDRNKLPTPATVNDWGAAMSCPMACAGRWCPWECPRVLGGES